MEIPRKTIESQTKCKTKKHLVKPKGILWKPQETKGHLGETKGNPLDTKGTPLNTFGESKETHCKPKDIHGKPNGTPSNTRGKPKGNPLNTIRNQLKANGNPLKTISSGSNYGHLFACRLLLSTSPAPPEGPWSLTQRTKNIHNKDVIRIWCIRAPLHFFGRRGGLG